MQADQSCIRLNLYFDVSEEAMAAYDLLTARSQYPQEKDAQTGHT